MHGGHHDDATFHEQLFTEHEASIALHAIINCPRPHMFIQLLQGEVKSPSEIVVDTYYNQTI